MVVLPEPLVGAAMRKAAIEREESELVSTPEREQARPQVNPES